MLSLRKSLSSKLSTTILLLAIPIFVLSLGILFKQSSNNVRKEAMEHANSVLNSTMLRVSRHLYTIETATIANDWLIEQSLVPDSILMLTSRIVWLNSHVDGCSISMEPDVFPQYGGYFSAYTVRKADTIRTVVEEEYDYFDKAWYKTPHQLGKPCWVLYYDETDSLEVTLDGMIASYCKPLYNTRKQFFGVISTDVSLRRLSKIITAEKPYPNSYFVMTDHEGRYCIHPNPEMLFTQTLFSGADPHVHADRFALGHEMTSGKKGAMSVDIDGVPCLVCYKPVPGTTWSLAIVSPEADILQGYYRLTYIVVSLIIVGLFVILLLSRKAVAHAIKPISQLLEKTQSIASGNYEVYIPRIQREDAVGRLQNSFATMLQSLNFHMGSVRYTAEQTERRNEELMRATRMAEESDRQKTAFIQNVSHQIRTPLNIVMGFAQVLRDYTGQMPEEEMKSITDTMRHNTSLLNRLLLMLFDSSDTGLSKEINSHKQDMVSCNDVAREAISYIRLHYPDISINFTSEVSDDFQIQTNRLYLMRSLREVLYNSAKYSDGQNVSLRIDKTDLTVRFVVQDTGKGIETAHSELVFMPFSKVDDLSEGLGLGLPLSKRHIRNLGGDLTLDTDYHDGCRFIVELPLTT